MNSEIINNLYFLFTYKYFLFFYNSHHFGEYKCYKKDNKSTNSQNMHYNHKTVVHNAFLDP